jgi:hypothetical protein
MSTLDVEAIRKRIEDSPIWVAHLPVNPCNCGSCNPVAHAKHPLNPELRQLMKDVRALLAEVERLRAPRCHECDNQNDPVCGHGEVGASLCADAVSRIDDNLTRGYESRIPGFTDGATRT